MPQAKKVAILASAALVVQILLSKFVYPIIFGNSGQTLFSIQPASGIGGQVFGDKVLGYLTGFTSFDLGSLAVWVSMFIGAFLLVYVGMYLYEQKTIRLPQGKNLSQRLVYLLLYGHVALYVLLLALKWGTVPSLALSLGVGLLINLAALSFVLTMSAKYLNFPKI